MKETSALCREEREEASWEKEGWREELRRKVEEDKKAGTE